MSPRPAVAVVVPDGIDDPTRPSGGNTYDRRLCSELAATGWSVSVARVPGSWPDGGPADRTRLAEVLAGRPGGSVVVVDGLVGLAAPEVMVPAGRRLRLVVLVHMPLSTATDSPEVLEGERAVLATAAAVVTTSAWTRSWLIARHRLVPGRVHVAAPGTDPAPLAAGSAGGDDLLCVGAVTPVKGHDLLVTALAAIADRSWHCTCVGATDRAPGFASALRRAVCAHRLGDRITFSGPLTGADLDAAYDAADVLVLPSRAETYGMVVTEALARGLPVLACETGGVAEALGTTVSGTRPGLLSPVGDVEALAGSVQRWLDDADLRQSLRHAARQRRVDLPRWSATAHRVSGVLQDLAA